MKKKKKKNKKKKNRFVVLGVLSCAVFSLGSLPILVVGWHGEPISFLLGELHCVVRRDRPVTWRLSRTHP